MRRLKVRCRVNIVVGFGEYGFRSHFVRKSEGCGGGEMTGGYVCVVVRGVRKGEFE